MESIKQKGVKFEMFDREWLLLFTTNVIDAIQDHFDINMNKDGISVIGKEALESAYLYDNLSFFIMTLINERIEIENEEAIEKQPLYTYEVVKRRVGIDNWIVCHNAITSAYSLAWLKKDNDDIDETPK